MDSSTIGLILTILVAVILVLSVLFGIKRGMKKTLFRFGWIFVTALILWFVTPALSNYLNSFDLTSYNLDIMGPVHRLSDIGVNLLNSVLNGLNNPELAETISQSSALNSFAQNLPTLVLNVVLFVLLFWLTKWILWPIWALISSKIFDKDKKAKKQYQKKLKSLKKSGMPIKEEDLKNVPQKKNQFRILGGVFGLVMGLLICAVTFSPIIGINNIYQNVYANVTTTNEQGEEVPYISTIVEDEEMLEIANCYEDSIASNVLTYTGMEFVSNFMFSNMAVVQVENESIKLTDEVNAIINAYNQVIVIDETTADFDNVTKEDVNRGITAIKELFFDIEDSKLIYVIGDDLLPKIIDLYIINNDEFTLEINGVDYATMLKEAYKESTANSPLTVASLQSQIDAVADIATLFNNNNLLLPIIKGEVGEASDIIALFANNINNTTSFSSTLVDELYNITLLEGQYPALIDDLIENVYESLEIGSFVSNENQMSNESLRSSLKNILVSALDFIKYYNESVDLNFGNNTQVALASIGRTIDYVKEGILSDESYNSLVSFIREQINSFASDFTDLTTVTSELNNVTSWEDEFRSLAPLYDVIIDIRNDDTPITADAVLNGEYSLNDVGVALQSVISSKNSKLVTNKNIKNILESLLNSLEDEQLNEYLNINVNGLTIKEIILNNIWDESQDPGQESKIADWGNELNYSLNLIVNINKTLINFDQDVVSSSDNNDLKILGKSIDDALSNTNLFISNEVLRSLIDYFMTSLRQDGSLPAELNEILDMTYTVNQTEYTVYEGMLNNIYVGGRTNVTSWENELNTLKVVFGDALNNTEDLASVGGVLDDLATSQILSRNIVREIVIHYVNQETASLEEGLQTPIQTMINIIRADSVDSSGNYLIKYETEIGNLMSLVDVVTASYERDPNTGASADYVKFDAIGSEFDRLCALSSSAGLTPSRLLTKQVINEFLAYYIQQFSTDFDEDMAQIISSIPGENNSNLNNIASYRIEFNGIMTLVETMQKENVTLVEIGIVIDDYKGRTVIIPNIIPEVAGYYIDRNIDITGNNSWLETPITSIKTNLNNLDISSVSFEKEFAYIDEFSDIVERQITITGDNSIGKFFDKVVGVNSESTYTSQILTKNVINQVLNKVLSDEIENKAIISADSDLKTIAEQILNNIGDIQSYQVEFDNLNTLLNLMNNDNLDTIELGKTLDGIVSISQLIKRENVISIVEYYFEDEMLDYTSGLYGEVITNIKNSISNVSSFEGLFTELDTLAGYFDSLLEINSIEDFRLSEQIGTDLDSIAETMPNIGGQTTAHLIANIFFEQLKSFNYNELTFTTEINQVLVDNNFENYLEGEVQTGYYTSLISQIKSAITSSIEESISQGE